MNVTQVFINKTKQATVQWYCRQNNKLTLALKLRVIEVNLFLLFAKELQKLTFILLDKILSSYMMGMINST